MKLAYYRIPGGNFGDDLNQELWLDIFPNLAEVAEHVTLWGIGTVLNRFPAVPRQNLVLGSGYGGGGSQPRQQENVDYLWVRGPKTAAVLGLSADRVLTDAAILWRPLLEAAKTEKVWKIGLVPHHASMAQYDWARLCAAIGVKLIDPRQEPLAVARQIAGCERVLTESLHGGIFADRLRVPFLPVILRHRFNYYKWQDWTRGMGLAFRPALINPALSDHIPNVAGVVKAAFWKLGAGMGACAPYRALRPMRASTAQDGLRAGEALLRVAERDDLFLMSAAGRVERLTDCMLAKCREVSSRFGLSMAYH